MSRVSITCDHVLSPRTALVEQSRIRVFALPLEVLVAACDSPDNPDCVDVCSGLRWNAPLSPCEGCQRIGVKELSGCRMDEPMIVGCRVKVRAQRGLKPVVHSGLALGYGGGLRRHERCS
jgi:hypothetical protein